MYSWVRVQGLGFRVQGFGLSRVWNLLGLRVFQGWGFRVQGLEFSVFQGWGVRVQGLGFARVQGLLGFRVYKELFCLFSSSFCSARRNSKKFARRRRVHLAPSLLRAPSMTVCLLNIINLYIKIYIYVYICIYIFYIYTVGVNANKGVSTTLSSKLSLK